LGVVWGNSESSAELISKYSSDRREKTPHRHRQRKVCSASPKNGLSNSFLTKHLALLDSVGYSLKFTIHPGGTIMLISCVWKLNQSDMLKLQPKIFARFSLHTAFLSGESSTRQIKCECLDAPRTARVEEAVYVPHNDVFSSFLSRWVQMLLGSL